MQREEPPVIRARVHRGITLAFGTGFVACAVVLLVVAGISWRTLVGALLIAGLGVDLIASAWCNRKSLLERIGPLP